MTCRRSQVRVLYRPPRVPRPKGLGTFFVVDGTGLEQHGTAAGGAANTPVGCLLVRGSQRIGMSTKKDAARPFGQGLFLLRHPLTHVRAGRYRTRTAAEATAACGGNREPRLGPRSDFSKPCQGAAEKSANATRTGASRQIPSRFPTPRNVYQERCRQTIRSRDFFRGGWYRTRTGTSKGRVSPWRWYPAFCFDRFYP